MKINQVCIIGLGYVGLPLANLIANKGYKVHGFDINQKSVEKINQGINPIEDSKINTENLKATSQESEEIKNSDIIIICVPTPVHSNFQPNLEPLKSALKTTKNNLRKGQLIILESTINPGVTESIAKPILEESGLKAGEDFYLAHCPERINPGDEKWNVENISRVVGGINQKSTDQAHEFYTSILSAEVKKMSSVKTAEAVKIVENTFRDINIAFCNELAKSFDKQGIDTLEVIEGAKTKPFAFLAHYPGCGVGGHCIPVDPYYLIEQASNDGFNHEFLKLAREINNSMPAYTVEQVTRSLNKVQKSVKGCKICVLGLSYKANIADTRESPSFQIIKILKSLEADVKIYDPYVLSQSDFKDLNSALNFAECLVIAVNHNEYINAELPSSIKVIVDGKNCLDKNKITEKGILYKGIGR
jgi:UDP-N-acetyl-D-glucosamine dehydrogenase